MSFRHARQPRPMVPVRSCINRVLQGDGSSGLEILFQNLRLLLTLWILHKWRTEKGQWTLMTVVSCSWFFAELHALGLCWAEYRFRTHQSHDVKNNKTFVHHRRGPSGDAREKKKRGKSWGSLKCHTSPPLEKKSRGNAWNVAAKRKSWTSLDVSFKLSTFYLPSTVFYLPDWILRALTSVARLRRKKITKRAWELAVSGERGEERSAQ